MFGGPRDSKGVGIKVLAFHVANSGLLPGIAYRTLVAPGREVISKHRTRCSS